MKNYILVGLGPHAKRIYYPFLEKYRARFDLRLKLLIDLDSQSAVIDEFLKLRELQPEKILYLRDTPANRAGGTLDAAALKALDALVRCEKIDGIIISTEPKEHKIYAEWALKNDVNVLMDKPLTAPLYPNIDEAAARRIYDDYLDLEALRNNSRARFYVTCQRRGHTGYAFIMEYLKNFVSECNVPVSYIDVYHADGVWNLPHEFQKENHPYKYGYGKLLHSGYHFVDLFSWIAQTNNAIERARPDAAKMYTSRFTPNDLFNQIDTEVCAKLFDRAEIRDFYKTYRRQDYEKFGELDVNVLVQLLRGPHVITTGTIHLQQNSFSNRGWFDVPADTYKGNGRVRHERVNIQVSHFLNIQVHSYQSSGTGTNGIEPGDVGGQDHFDILIFRNAKIVGGQNFQKISIGKEMQDRHGKDAYYLGHNEEAREKTLRNFIETKNDESELAHHKLTNQLLSNIYLSIAQDVQTGDAQIHFPLCQ